MWRMVYNNDGSPHLFAYPFPMTSEQLTSKIDHLAAAGVDVFVLQMGSGNLFLHDTKVGEFYTAKLPRHRFNAAKNARDLIARGLDPMRVLCDRAHHHGMKFLAGLRMNDLHDLWFKEWICRRKKEHPDMLIGTKGRPPAPSTRDWDHWDPDPRRLAWNFADSRVVQMRLALLQETVRKYDVDGLELDFLRMPIYFPPGTEKEHAHILTGLVREIREMVDKKAEGVARALELGAIIPYSPQVCGAIGMEIDTWLAEGLLDYIVPRATDLFLTEIPFEEWKALIAGCKTRLLGGTFTNGKFEDDVYFAMASRCRQATLELLRVSAPYIRAK